MRARSAALAARKAELIATSAAQRAHLASLGRALAGPAARVDRTIRFFREVRRHPLLLAALVAGAVVAARRGRLLPLASRAWAGWQLWRRVRVKLAEAPWRRAPNPQNSS